MTDNKLVMERISEEEGIVWLTFNRPEKKNALLRTLLDELAGILKALRNNDNIRCSNNRCRRLLTGGCTFGEKLALRLREAKVILAKAAIPQGADRAYVVDSLDLQNYQTEIYVQVLEKMCKDLSPRILLMGQTAIGRDLAPRLAFRLVTGLSTDCIDLAIDPANKQLQQIRPVYGGNFQAVFTIASEYPHMATIRSKAFEPLKPDAGRQGSVIPYTVEIDTIKDQDKIRAHGQGRSSRG